MNKVKAQCSIRAPGDQVVKFSATVHVSTTQDERQLEADFYGVHHPGVHHEMELVEPAVWEHEQEAHIHHHRIGDGRHFLCFTGHVKTLGEAEATFRTWCLGTAYTMGTGEDFAKIFTRGPATFEDTLTGLCHARRGKGQKQPIRGLFLLTLTY